MLTEKLTQHIEDLFKNNLITIQEDDDELSVELQKSVVDTVGVEWSPVLDRFLSELITTKIIEEMDTLYVSSSICTYVSLPHPIFMFRKPTDVKEDVFYNRIFIALTSLFKNGSITFTEEDSQMYKQKRALFNITSDLNLVYLAHDYGIQHGKYSKSKLSDIAHEIGEGDDGYDIFTSNNKELTREEFDTVCEIMDKQRNKFYNS